jgi:hypothetical protein
MRRGPLASDSRTGGSAPAIHQKCEAHSKLCVDLALSEPGAQAHSVSAGGTHHPGNPARQCIEKWGMSPAERKTHTKIHVDKMSVDDVGSWYLGLDVNYFGTMTSGDAIVA